LGLLLRHCLLPQFLDKLWDRHSCFLRIDGELPPDGLDLLWSWLLARLRREPLRVRGALGLLGRIGHYEGVFGGGEEWETEDGVLKNAEVLGRG
jgi:hypothetical protein